MVKNRNTFRWSIATLAFLMFAIVSVAGNVNELIITEKSGTETKFLFTDKPQLTIVGSKVVATSNSNAIVIAMADIADFHFADSESEPSAIETPQASGQQFRGGIVSGMSAGAFVGIYSTDGRLIKSIKSDNDGTARIDMSDMVRGTYIIKTPGATYKVINK